MNQQLNNLLEVGEIILEDGISGHHILFLSIIGEIEGHNLSSERIKTTKYEHLLPILAKAQDSEEIEGIFFLINTVGGDCSCGLAVAEMIASIKKPTIICSGRSNIHCTNGDNGPSSGTFKWNDNWCTPDF